MARKKKAAVLCERCGKKSYRTYEDATATALRRSRFRYPLRVYACPILTGKWHLTKMASRW